VTAARAILLTVGAAVVFLAGVGFGEALDDNGERGRTQTLLRTLDPLPLAPAARTTVTITTSKP
jgi:hypothetical protein